eukprot:scaffold2069_cov254-Pinguiococcus_pyrenoidosus.AAC.27
MKVSRELRRTPCQALRVNLGLVLSVFMALTHPYLDEGADVMGKITSFFSGKKEEKEQPKAAKAEKPASEATEEKKDKPFFGLF